MMRLAGMFFATLIAMPVSAETVQVSSGEHEDFTRLVFKIDPAREWALQTNAQKAELIVNGSSITFADSIVFDRIPQTRLVSVAQTSDSMASRYQMNLGCACVVTAFAYLDTYIVVDIHDSDGPLPPDPIIASVMETQRIKPLLVPLDVQENAYVMPSSTARTTAGLEEPSAIVDPVAVDTKPTEVSQTDTTDDELAKIVSEARTKLLEQLTFAAEMGLLDFEGGHDPVTDQPMETVDTTVSEVVLDEGVGEQRETIEETLPGRLLEDQFTITTVYERDTRHIEGPLNHGLIHCPTDEQLDIGSWSTENSFSDQLSILRSGLLKEFDDPDLQVAERLVKLYIRYGFGAEAVSYLQDYGAVIEDADLLRDMAAVMDGKSAKPDGPLAKAESCAGAAGLWSMVGLYPELTTSELHERSILAAFAELPADVRRTIGPRLSLAFSNRNFVGSARLVSDILERAPGDHGDYQRLNSARYARDNGDIDAAKNIYQDLVARNSGATIIALIELAQMLLDEEYSAPASLVEDLGAAADEVRGTKEGFELRRLEGLWLQNIGGGMAALELIAKERAVEDLNAEKLGMIAGEILFKMSPDTDGQMQYVRSINEYLYLIDGNADNAVLLLDIGTKLIEAGLPNMALDIIHPLVVQGDIPAKVMSAKGLLANFDPDSAIRQLAGLTGDEVREIRIQAFLNLGAFEKTLQELSKLGDKPHFDLELTWYPGDWTVAAQQNVFAKEILDRFVQVENPYPDSSTLGVEVVENAALTLAETTALLQRSSAVSEELSALFNAD